MQKGRPKKQRIIESRPEVNQFSPRGRRGRPGYINLKYDEFETIRLMDYKGSRQGQAASQMGVSQQTISRILKAARAIIADAIVKGKIINIIPDKNIK